MNPASGRYDGKVSFSPAAERRGKIIFSKDFFLQAKERIWL